MQMAAFELSNEQRKHFGLLPVSENWDKEIITDNITVYYDNDIIVKVINYSYVYLEYDSDIHTNNRKSLTARTSKGREQKITLSNLLKIRGSGVQFSISFEGGGITVYDNRRSLFFIKSYFEDGHISNFNDAANWISKFIQDNQTQYFFWLNDQLKQKRKTQKAKAGDIIAFKISHHEYGFARIIKGIQNRKKNEPIISITNDSIFPYSLTVATYAFVSDTLEIDIEKLIALQTLPSIYILDNPVHTGEMPIIGNRALNNLELNIPAPTKNETSITITYTKTDIQNFILHNNISIK